MHLTVSGGQAASYALCNSMAYYQSNNPSDPYTYTCGGISGNTMWVTTLAASEVNTYCDAYGISAQVRISDTTSSYPLESFLKQ